ncbi:CBS domain containing protein [Candidatus Desulforudis audaxviator MP104C]|uniref:CBS domain containing protein n=2 Tax=Candidatus Desulforudis TaxID=471826 RepID=B1I6P7_DESAP|nr:CBS domain containing protein [Candidatus Desulforudis audaxviator MP104C]AZK60779.1 CBS domain protein [Candidatus Desulforudis audaxviator]
MKTNPIRVARAMFVQDCMTSNPITITLDTPIFQALDIMTRRKVRHLPVFQGSRLVGLVTERGLLQVSPSPATTLSMHELNYVLAKVTVKEALVKDPVWVPPQMPIEEAAQVMRQKKIGSLLVMEDGKLVGIVSQTDIVEALVRLFGLHRAGTRLVIDTEDRVGVLADITQFFKERGINIISVVTMRRDEKRFHLVFRVSIADAGALVAEIEGLGFKVVSVS